VGTLWAAMFYIPIYCLLYCVCEIELNCFAVCMAWLYKSVYAENEDEMFNESLKCDYKFDLITISGTIQRFHITLLHYYTVLALHLLHYYTVLGRHLLHYYTVLGLHLLHCYTVLGLHLLHYYTVLALHLLACITSITLLHCARTASVLWLRFDEEIWISKC